MNVKLFMLWTTMVSKLLMSASDVNYSNITLLFRGEVIWLLASSSFFFSVKRWLKKLLHQRSEGTMESCYVVQSSNDYSIETEKRYLMMIAYYYRETKRKGILMNVSSMILN